MAAANSGSISYIPPILLLLLLLDPLKMLDPNSFSLK